MLPLVAFVPYATMRPAPYRPFQWMRVMALSRKEVIPGDGDLGPKQSHWYIYGHGVGVVGACHRSIERWTLRESTIRSSKMPSEDTSALVENHDKCSALQQPDLTTWPAGKTTKKPIGTANPGRLCRIFGTEVYCSEIRTQARFEMFRY